MLERTYEYRLYLTKVQQKNFEQIADTTRALYNIMLKDRTEHYHKTGKWKRINPTPFVKGSLLMKELEPSIVKWTAGNLERAYIQFFFIRKNRPKRYQPEALQKAEEKPDYQLMDTDLIGYPKIKIKSNRESFDIGPSQVLVMPERVTIPGIGNIKIRLHRPIPAGAKIHHYTILKKASGHFFLLIHLQIPDPEEKTNIKKSMGIALEPKMLIQCSDGRPVVFHHQSPAIKRKIERAYENLSRKKPGSNQYEKQRKRLASLYEKRVNQRRDSLHKISKEIVAKADIIAIEEPLVQRKKKKLLKKGTFETVHDEAWWTFSSYLKYKTLSVGKRFWRAPGGIPVRDACSICGVISTKQQRSAEWKCPYCGVSMTSALNAAKNLERLAIQGINESGNSLKRQE